MTNTKNTKRALLSSVLALFLCFAMLLGTTYAWFTDSVTSANNIIKSGNLDIELEYAKVVDGAITEWDTVAGKDNIFDKNALWEPGRVEVVYLKVSNLGTLALKYQLGVNIVNEIGGKNVAGEDFKLSDHLVFKVVDLATEPETAYTREEAVAEAGNVKGLKDYNSDTTALEVGGTDYVALIVYMPENVGNEANYRGDAIPTITLGINLYATQQMSEKDSFGDNYDEYAGLPWDGESKEDPKADENGVIHVTNAAELVAMMDTTGNSIYSGKTIVLDADINLGGKTVKGIGGDDNFAGVFDGQGHTISNFTVDASNRSYYAGLFNQVSHGGTVKNLTVKGATIIGNSMVGAVASSVDLSATVDNCRAIGCTLIGVKKVGAVVGYSAGSTVTNNYAENCAVYYSEKEGAEILGYENTGSTVNNNTFTDVEVVNATVILDADDLVALGGTKINGNYVLMADLDMNGKVMKSMEVSGGASVNFIGNGYTISNLTLNATGIHGMTGANNEVAGLFDLTAPATTVSLTVSDLSFDNATVTCDGYAGVVVGYNPNGGTVITLNNVDVNGATVTSDTVAALVGYTTGVVNLTDCDVSGLALAGEAGRPDKVGAYVGTANGDTCAVTVTNCTNGTVYNYAGRVIYDATMTIDGITYVTNADGLAKAVANGATNILLADGEYNVANCGGGKTLTLTGSKNAVLKLYNEGEDGCDYGFDGSTVTFNGLTINTTANTGNYKGYARMTATFNDCTFFGAYTTHNVQTFNNCTFDFNNGYLWIWGATEVNFNNCEFGGTSKTILAHGGESTVININDCDFAATTKGYTGAGDHTAVVEIDPTGSNTYTINFTGENTMNENYAGWTRVKDGSTGHTVTGLN